MNQTKGDAGFVSGRILREEDEMRIGIDVGSTTIKCVVLDDENKIIHNSYERHFAMIIEKTKEVVEGVIKKFNITEPVKLAISGSAGMGLAENAGIPFVQEVYATKVAVSNRIPDTDVVIELGGEDAKILFLKGNLEVRMNGTCAGGTGAFADQMASLMNITGDEMNELAMNSDKVYSIASRCGVFAKTDIQPLLNQGARKEDISASIYKAIVNQTITGLAQGHPIEGNVVYLGGPLTFMSYLRDSFDEALHLKGTLPDDSLLFVALGAAYYANESIDLNEALAKIGEKREFSADNALEPLFKDEAEYKEFSERHAKDTVQHRDSFDISEEVFLGIDSGSTTLKLVLIDKDGSILYSRYTSNQGRPIDVVVELLKEMYEKYPDIKVTSAAVTGYGEEMMKSALGIDLGIVETVAHFTAAKFFLPDVEFIIDIGGQDMKCFKIRNGAIDNIFLNEACSSGCGSFLQTFAGSLGYEIAEFAKIGLFGKKPVDLGSRCTVFMNSSVKQAQKEGVSVEDISAGLSISVVKNALYKVIRVNTAKELGERIVVQGGTFLNDAVLRAFEKELGVNVIRPDIAGMMGAYGAALYAERSHAAAVRSGKVSRDAKGLISKQELDEFTYETKSINCSGCNNHCNLTVNTFPGGRRFIGGNKCEKPVTQKSSDDSHNLYEYKLKYFEKLLETQPTEPKQIVGLPMALNMYEMLPFWHAFFTKLGYGVKISGFSNRKMYIKGQGTIPSDTVCFPAKMVHGHIIKLIEDEVDAIFFPCLTFNFNEHHGENHYNCAVIAGYPEVIGANIRNFGKSKYICEYLGPHNKGHFKKSMWELMNKHFGPVSRGEVNAACEAAYAAYAAYENAMRVRAAEIIDECRQQGKKIVCLAGRPYHTDPEINHGIHKLIAQLGFGVISEDSISHHMKKLTLNLRNQWTYHARLFSAAAYVSRQPDMYLVHLVSFGCGLDAITTDEVRSILESEGCLYTQIKIDEVTNLGAVKIRLRSLIAAIKQAEEEASR